MVKHLDNMYCAAIRRGDVVLCSEKDKEQLYVVLQDDVLNQSLPTMVCVPVEIYKKGDEVLVNEVLLKKGETGLGSDSVCFLHKVITIERVHVVAKKAELKKERVQELLHALDITLGRFRDRN
ncbi:hypothetical protein C0581_00955 [Candidatus Parcubacteria bacterium]|nr:MAG: hypothetical protein C0581_00955 [Candidatus Parcubacteria bacterium]